MRPDASTIAASPGPRDRDRVTGLTHEIADRSSASRSGCLALP
ncbi:MULTISPECIES: hypothetical protein [unclassified Nonomuraea]|nr:MULTISPECIES: hypothetical protein [unclassified Nonomuraea]